MSVDVSRSRVISSPPSSAITNSVSVPFDRFIPFTKVYFASTPILPTSVAPFVSYNTINFVSVSPSTVYFRSSSEVAEVIDVAVFSMITVSQFAADCEIVTSSSDASRSISSSSSMLSP